MIQVDGYRHTGRTGRSLNSGHEIVEVEVLEMRFGQTQNDRRATFLRRIQNGLQKVQVHKVERTYRIPVRVGAIAIMVIFIFAFLTYFGTPFYSEAAHKGVI